MRHSLPLLRPLAAPILRLQTEQGPGYFLLDSGSPSSFAAHAERVPAGEGGLHPYEDIILSQPRFDLHGLEEVIGVTLEGVIGGDLIKRWGCFELDLDHASVTFTNSTAHSVSERQAISMDRPFRVRASYDDGPFGESFVDLGSRFNLLPPGVVGSGPIYKLEMPSISGPCVMGVSAGHTLSLETVDGVALPFAGLDAGHWVRAPMALPFAFIGLSWVARHNLVFDFRRGRLLAVPRERALHIWERGLCTEDAAPPFEVRLDPARMDEHDRPFQVVPRVGIELPPGLGLSTDYRMEGVMIPAGPEGVNDLFEALLGAPGSEVVLSSDAVRVAVARVPLFRERGG